LFQTIEPWRVDLGIQTYRCLASHPEKPDKTANLSNHVLQAPPAVPDTRMGDKTLDMGWRQITEPKGRFPIQLVVQKLSGSDTVLFNGYGGQPPDFTQVLTVVSHSRIEQGGR
jgi:hypothetical protein